MRIELRGRGGQADEELLSRVEKKLGKVAKQVSEAATLEVEFTAERSPTEPDHCIAEATLHLKGVSLRARDASRDHKHALNLVADDMARQVKRHRDKRRNRREARAEAMATRAASMGGASARPTG